MAHHWEEVKAAENWRGWLYHSQSRGESKTLMDACLWSVWLLQSSNVHTTPIFLFLYNPFQPCPWSPSPSPFLLPLSLPPLSFPPPLIFLSLGYLLSFFHPPSCFYSILLAMFSLQVSLPALYSSRCLWLFSPSHFQEKLSPQPHLRVAMSSLYPSGAWMKWGHDHF